MTREPVSGNLAGGSGMVDDTFKLASRFVRGYGLVEVPAAQSSSLLASYTFGASGHMRVIEQTSDPAVSLSFLSQLTLPASRHVLFPIGDSFSALVNNRRDGSDYTDYVQNLSRHLGARFARVICSPSRVWSNGRDSEVLEYEARIFELYDPRGQLIRSVTCMDDGGRWSFHESGSPHEIEASFPYAARRKRDRFTSSHLSQLICAFGLSPANEQVFLAAGSYFLLEETSPVYDSCTIAQADDPAYHYYRRGLTWVNHMKTHAASVIADFERCIRLNPEYEPKVRESLDLAYKAVGRE